MLSFVLTCGFCRAVRVVCLDIQGDFLRKVSRRPHQTPVGLSVRMQSRLLDLHSEWLRGLFSRVKKASWAAMGRRQTLAVAVYCKSGRHRSVAGVEIATNVLQNDGCVVIKPTNSLV